jgi:superoxide dismutase, Fe-Mn family
VAQRLRTLQRVTPTADVQLSALPPLPYEYAALEPWIDAETMHLHHGCHHLQCVRALAESEERLAVARSHGERHLVGRLQELATFYAAEHYLHCLFWEVMGPNQGGQPRGELADQIADDFGSFGGFKWQFSAVARGLEVGGWVVLAWDTPRRHLVVSATGYGRPSALWGCEPLLALDVREHAYYLRYQHRRSEYVHNWWNTVNWIGVGRRFSNATQAQTGRTRSERKHRDETLRVNRDTRSPIGAPSPYEQPAMSAAPAAPALLTSAKVEAAGNSGSGRL